jgi:hypothetical protein
MSGQFINVVSAVNVKVDTDEVSIVAGSLKYKSGKPTRNFEGTENGDIAVSEDFVDAIGMVSFELHSSKENLDYVKRWESIRNAFTVSFWDDNGFRRTMVKGLTTNDSEKSLGADGKVPVEIKGTPVD